jgi:hypothetical protein
MTPRGTAAALGPRLAIRCAHTIFGSAGIECRGLRAESKSQGILSSIESREMDPLKSHESCTTALIFGVIYRTSTLETIDSRNTVRGEADSPVSTFPK